MPEKAPEYFIKITDFDEYKLKYDEVQEFNSKLDDPVEAWENYKLENFLDTFTEEEDKKHSEIFVESYKKAIEHNLKYLKGLAYENIYSDFWFHLNENERFWNVNFARLIKLPEISWD